MWKLIKTIFLSEGLDRETHFEVEKPLICRKTGEVCRSKILNRDQSNLFAALYLPCKDNRRCMSEEVEELLKKDKEKEERKNKKLNEIFSNYEG